MMPPTSFTSSSSSSTIQSDRGSAVARTSVIFLSFLFIDVTPLVNWLELFFFFLMIRRPPRSPPFPSTTLFRSPFEERLRAQGRGGDHPVRPRLSSLAADTRRGAGPFGIWQTIVARWPKGPAPRRGAAASDEDRKSTRLNSNHLVISYAGFFFKK